MENKETHPDWYFHVPEMRSLILGSFPPHPKRWDYEFYYPNSKNHFWYILAELAGRPIVHTSGREAVEERKELMRSLSVGVENMGKEIMRKGESALDGDIKITGTHDIKGILESCDGLESILLPGYSGSSSTFSTFKRYLKFHEIEHSGFPKAKAGESFEIYFQERTIGCFLANSTSYTAKRAGVTFEMLVEQFGRAIGR